MDADEPALREHEALRPDDAEDELRRGLSGAGRDLERQRGADRMR